MDSDAGENKSIWMQTTDIDPIPVFEGDEEADVCIVGAGIAGLTTAYCLARAGRSVIVLDDGPIAGGETSRTTAHLVSALDDYYHELEKLHGKEGARLAAESHTAAIDEIERIVADADIKCQFLRLDGYLFAAEEDDAEILSNELQAARRAGLRVEHVEHVPVDFHDFGPALRFSDQAQFHPLKYISGLSRVLRDHGVRIYTSAHVMEVVENHSVRVQTERGPKVLAHAAVVATNTPVIDRVAIHTKQAAYRTYAIAARIPKGSLLPVLLWDTCDPYHYVRLHLGNGTDGHDWLIVGGEDHKTGQPEEDASPYEDLESWTRERFPMVRDVPLKWSGQVMEPVDSLAFIGRNPGNDNVYIATGDSGNGMTHGTIAGLLLSDLIRGRKNPWEALYEPSRKSVRAIPSCASENLNVVGQYKEHLPGGDEESVTAIAAGEGAILR